MSKSFPKSQAKTSPKVVKMNTKLAKPVFPIKIAAPKYPSR